MGQAKRREKEIKMIKSGAVFWESYWLEKEPDNQKRSEIESSDLISIAEIEQYLQITYKLMIELGIKVRETFSTPNQWDHFTANGRCYYGIRQIRFYWSDVYVNAMQGGRKYKVKIPNDSHAWEIFWATFPKRYRDEKRIDPIVHECVHFLQELTDSDDENYIPGGLVGSADYRNQRVEREAHLVQALYAARNRTLSDQDRNLINSKIMFYLTDKTEVAAIGVIDTARSLQLI